MGTEAVVSMQEPLASEIMGLTNPHPHPFNLVPSGEEGGDDLKLRVIEASLVCPAEGTPEHTLFLSNLDQIVIFPVDTAYYFPLQLNSPPTTLVTAKLKDALSRLLVPYYFMAGRLKMSSSEKRLELNCNGKGALFITTSSDLTLDELSSLVLVRPAADVRDLVLHPSGITCFDDLPITIIQVTMFRCGGFALGISTNHTLLDGQSAAEFLNNFASLARGEELITNPNPNRTSLRSRSPPHVEHNHYEYAHVPKSSEILNNYNELGLLHYAGKRFPPSDKYTYRKFAVSSSALKRLKEKVGSEWTTFESLVAFVWKCRTRAVGMEAGEISTMIFAVDFRKVLEPPLPNNFAGNAVLSTCARLSADEVLRRPLSYLAEKVREARGRVTNDYVRSCLDHLELRRGIPVTSAGVYVTSWWRLSFQTLDFGWGSPAYGGPIISGLVEFVVLVPDSTSVTSDPNHHQPGMTVVLALEDHHMLYFAELFYHL